MRFPDIPFMKPIFDLILRNPRSPIAGMLEIMPYVIDNPNNLNFYNGIIKTNAELQENPPPLDPFKTGIDPPNTVSNMMQAAIGDLKAKFQTPPFDDGWDYLMQFDHYSTRNYIALVKPKYADAVSD
jgi:hypothetical protein